MELSNTKPFPQNQTESKAPTRKLHIRLGLELVALIVFLLIWVFMIWLMVFSSFVNGPALVLCLGFGMVTFNWVKRVRRQARRYSVLDGATEMERDTRPPILYLRSFLDDYSGNDLRPDQRTDEELLRFMLKEAGPVVAIGEPGEALPPLGAARLYVSDNWESVVQKLISDARLVFMSPGISEGLKKEMCFVRTLQCEQKVIFPLMSGTPKTYQSFQRVFQEVFGVALPKPPKKPVFLYFADQNRPAFVVAYNWAYKLYSNKLVSFLLGDGEPVVAHESLRLFLKSRNIALKRSRVFIHMISLFSVNLVALSLLLTLAIGLARVLGF